MPILCIGTWDSVALTHRLEARAIVTIATMFSKVVYHKIHEAGASCHAVKPFTTQSRLLTTLRKEPFENLVGNGENAGNQHSLNFPQCFLHFHSEKNSIFDSH